jgi:hypothetical protein
MERLDARSFEGGVFWELQNPREDVDPDVVFDRVIAQFAWVEYAACRSCREWMNCTYPGRGVWAMDHAHCGVFCFFSNLHAMPGDYRAGVGPLELLASLPTGGGDGE